MSSSFDPEEYLRIAEELAARESDEAALRSAVGRAYYAAVLLAAQVTGTERQRGFHAKLRMRLEELNHRNLATYMGTMSTLRDVADYQAIPDDPRNQDWLRNWRQVHRYAQQTIPVLKAILAEQSKAP